MKRNCVIPCLLVLATIPKKIQSIPAAFCPENASGVEGYCRCNIHTVKFTIQGHLRCVPCLKCGPNQVQSHRCNNVNGYKKYEEVTCLDECPSAHFKYRGTCKECEKPCELNQIQKQDCVGGLNRVCVCRKPYYHEYGSSKCIKRCSPCKSTHLSKRVSYGECLDFPEDHRCIEEKTTPMPPTMDIDMVTTVLTPKSVITTTSKDVTIDGKESTTTTPMPPTTGIDMVTTVLTPKSVITTTSKDVTIDGKESTSTTVVTSTSGKTTTALNINSSESTSLYTTKSPNRNHIDVHIFYYVVATVLVLILVLILIWYIHWNRRSTNGSANSSVADSPLLPEGDFQFVPTGDEIEMISFGNSTLSGKLLSAGQPNGKTHENKTMDSKNNNQTDGKELTFLIKDMVCQRANEDVEKLGKQLMLPEEVIVNVLSTSVSVYEKANKILNHWVRRSRNTPLWEDLKSALELIPRYDIINDVEKMLKEPAKL